MATITTITTTTLHLVTGSNSDTDLLVATLTEGSRRWWRAITVRRSWTMSSNEAQQRRCRITTRTTRNEGVRWCQRCRCTWRRGDVESLRVQDVMWTEWNRRCVGGVAVWWCVRATRDGGVLNTDQCGVPVSQKGYGTAISRWLTRWCWQCRCASCREGPRLFWWGRM